MKGKKVDKLVKRIENSVSLSLQTGQEEKKIKAELYGALQIGEQELRGPQGAGVKNMAKNFVTTLINLKVLVIIFLK